MKKSILASLFMLGAVTAIAAPSQFYVMGQAGAGSSSPGLLDTWLNSYQLQDNKGFTGRVGAGWDFNPNFAVEAGLAAYPSATRVDNPNVLFFHPDLPATTSKISDIMGVDLLAKASIHVKSAQFYVSGGASAVQAKFAAPSPNDYGHAEWQTGSATFVVPKFGMGVTLPVDQQLAFDLRLMSSPSQGELADRNYLPELNTATLGIKWSPAV